MEIVILQTIEEFKSRIGNRYGIYLVTIDGKKQVISRNENNFYVLNHTTTIDIMSKVTGETKKEMFKVFGY